MQSLNCTELIGRLGSQPDMCYTVEGHCVTKLCLDTNRPIW